jgi:hypothetical protein
MPESGRGRIATVNDRIGISLNIDDEPKRRKN